MQKIFNIAVLVVASLVVGAVAGARCPVVHKALAGCCCHCCCPCCKCGCQDCCPDCCPDCRPDGPFWGKKAKK